VSSYLSIHAHFRGVFRGINTVSECTLACNLDCMTRYLLARMLVEAAQSGKGWLRSDRQPDLTNREMSVIIGGVSDPISWGQLTSQVVAD